LLSLKVKKEQIWNSKKWVLDFFKYIFELRFDLWNRYSGATLLTIFNFIKTIVSSRFVSNIIWLSDDKNNISEYYDLVSLSIPLKFIFNLLIF